MKIAVCDDDNAALSQLSRYIREYAGKNLLDYTVLEFDSGELLLEAAAVDPDIRILFLDKLPSPEWNWPKNCGTEEMNARLSL
ncbi:hypothetical protein [[Clostridium] symbiosum]|uniref:hypothetical protein n=1 Tax=Clostridium symbiosum TaxID=1512 RepID=UPI001FAE3B08|nr:hypothetical protein [[Clostridium] symbiosum]